MELVLRLHPDLRRIVIVGGTAAVDRRAIQRARAAAEAARGRVSADILDGLSMDELRRLAVGMPAHSAILFTRMFRDGAGQSVISAEVGQWPGGTPTFPSLRSRTL
ncbi:MAG TPA: hypothetical protein VHP37_32040 [Burkholderiales bacterium]|nr:hypothetical protein [Burkholderiales bacterium]